MKRPLAVAGFAVVLVLLAAGSLPATLLLPLGLAAAVMAIAAIKIKPGYAVVALGAAAFALLYRAGFDAVAVRGMTEWEGCTAQATLRVLECGEAPSYMEDYTSVKAEVLTLNGQKAGFKTYLYTSQAVQPGDLIAVEGLFRESAQNYSAWYFKVDGLYLELAQYEAVTITGHADNLATLLRRLQYASAENILEKLPARLGGVAAAMTVGDRRHMANEAYLAYTRSGLGHMVVVSGLHLSLLVGVVYNIVYGLGRRRRLAAGLGIAFVLFFMVFTGFSASIVRSGFMHILILAGPFFSRRADAYTSMGLALLLLCIANPYAALNMGLQLSFVSTLTLLAVGDKLRALQAKWKTQGAGPLLRFGRWLFCIVLPPTAVVFAALPVLQLNNSGISLMTVPMNILFVWLLAPIVLCGFIMVIPAGVPVLGLLARLAALIGGSLLALLEAATNWCASLKWVYQPTGGSFALVVTVVVYLLLYCAYKYGYKRLFLSTASGTLVLAVALHVGLGANVVYIALTGGQNPSVVAIQNNRAVILYRGSNTDRYIQDTLWLHGATQTALVIDLRASAQGTQYARYNAAEEVIAANLISGYTAQPLEDVQINLRVQGGGFVVFLHIGGKSIAVTTGKADLTPYNAANIVIAGTGSIEGGAGTLLTPSTTNWAGWPGEIYYTSENTLLRMRPSGGIQILEAEDGNNG